MKFKEILTLLSFGCSIASYNLHGNAQEKSDGKLYKFDQIKTNLVNIANSGTQHCSILNLEKIIENHTIGIKKEYLSNLNEKDNICLNVKRAEDSKIFGQYILRREEIIQDNNSDIKICFKYLPKNFFIEVENKGGIIEKSKNINHQILKTIIVDRDSRPQKIYLIEGDKFDPFSYISGWSLISTGLSQAKDRFPTQPTPLGYYYIRSKEKNGFNGRGGRNWKMPFALWLTKESGTPEGINGLHAYEHTKFGRPASHGCVRIPYNFAKDLFGWSEIKTPVFIIGRYDQSDTDSERFDFRDYNAYKSLISSLELCKKNLENEKYDSSIIKEENIQKNITISEAIKKIREIPFNSLNSKGKNDSFRECVNTLK